MITTTQQYSKGLTQANMPSKTYVQTYIAQKKQLPLTYKKKYNKSNIH